MPDNTYISQSISDVGLTQSADLFDNLDNIAALKCKSGKPMTFENTNQAYGFAMYSTFVNYTDDKRRRLKLFGLHDRALIYGNDEYLGCYMRDREMPAVTFNVPKDGMKLEILVESMGRVNYETATLSDKK